MEALGQLGAADLAAVMAAYRQALRVHQEILNRQNVYPVPDGDTGTNMALTIDSVVRELGNIEGLEALSGLLQDDVAVPGADGDGAVGNGTGGDAQAGIRGRDQDDEPPRRAWLRLSAAEGLEMAAVCQAISHGSLMGARGNSGVILSQLLRGLTGVLRSADEPRGTELAAALEAASEAAYGAVLRPVEGTMLTVARAAAEGARAAGDNGPSLLAVLESARSAADEALARTPELLPALAQAGVVDAGGGGYLLLLDALLTVVDGRALPEAPKYAAGDPATSHLGEVVAARGHANPGASPSAPGDHPHAAGVGGEPARTSDAHAGPGELRYEVMYFLEALDDTIPAFKEVWEGIGDSIVVVGGDGLWNCHIHTDDVGAAVEAGIDAGRPRDIRVSDLAEQVEEERWVREGATSADRAAERVAGPPVTTAVVAVANGEGVGRIFRSLGVHHLVPGGQSMNPSTEQILTVLEEVASDGVVILPNNENIVPVAMQACELCSKTVRVVPTSGIVEGFAALLEYDPQAGAEENVRSMSASARRVVAGEVTQAVRDASGPGGDIRAGDWMGLSRDGVEVVGASMAEVACGLLGKLLGDDHELVTLIEGEGAVGAQTRRITEWLAEHRPDVAVEVHHGGQPLYPYLLSIE